MRILEATTTDLEAILELQYVAYRSEAERYDDLSIPPLRQTILELIEEAKRSIVLKAIEEGRILGSVRRKAEGDVCRVNRLIVHPEVQRRGIGTSLLQSVERYFPTVARFELFTGSGSTDNLRLYTKVGYKESRRKKYNDKITFVFLEKMQHEV